MMAGSNSKLGAPRASKIRAKQRLASKVTTHAREKQETKPKRENIKSDRKCELLNVIGALVVTLRQEDISRCIVKAAEVTYDLQTATEISKLLFQSNETKCQSRASNPESDQLGAANWEETLGLVKETVLEK